MSALLGPGRAGRRRLPRACGSCPGCSRTTPASTRRRPRGCSRSSPPSSAVALLGQGLMLLLARRVRDVVTAPAARAVDSGLGLRGGARHRHARRVGRRRGGAAPVARRAARDLVSPLGGGVGPRRARAVVGRRPRRGRDPGLRPQRLPEGVRGARARADRTGRRTRRRGHQGPGRRAGARPRWCTCAPSPTTAGRPRSAAAGSWPRAGWPPTPTSWRAPTGSR